MENINNEVLKIMNEMKDINYGYVDASNNKHIEVDDEYSKFYRLQSPLKLTETKLGVCWDQVELERYYFSKTNYKYKTFFLVYYNNDDCPTHTFLIYQENNKYYWFEHSWEKYRGIREYHSIDNLLCDVINKFIDTELDNNYLKDNLKLYEYSTPKYNIDVKDYYKHCESGKEVDIYSFIK